MKPFVNDIPWTPDRDWPTQEEADFDDIPIAMRERRPFRPLDPQHLSTSHIINRIAWCWRMHQLIEMGLHENPQGLPPLDTKVLASELDKLRLELEKRKRSARRSHKDISKGG
jgi:hypothetical protein